MDQPQVAKFCIDLEWKSFPIDLNTVETWIKTNHAEDGYCGNSAGKTLQLWFLNNLTDEQVAQVKEYYAAITETSDETKNYKTAMQRQAAQAASSASLKASGGAKLKALGFSDDEIAAFQK